VTYERMTISIDHHSGHFLRFTLRDILHVSDTAGSKPILRIIRGTPMSRRLAAANYWSWSDVVRGSYGIGIDGVHGPIGSEGRYLMVPRSHHMCRGNSAHHFEFVFLPASIVSLSIQRLCTDMLPARGRWLRQTSLSFVATFAIAPPCVLPSCEISADHPAGLIYLPVDRQSRNAGLRVVHQRDPSPDYFTDQSCV